MVDVSDGRVECIRDVGALRLRSFRDGDRHVIALAGELDLATGEAVGCELERVESTDAGVIVLDLCELEFMDTSGLRVILMAHRRLASRLVVEEGLQFVQRVLGLRHGRARWHRRNVAGQPSGGACRGGAGARRDELR